MAIRKRINNELQNTTQKTKDWATNPTKNVGELRCSGRVSISCSTSGTHQVLSHTCLYHMYISPSILPQLTDVKLQPFLWVSIYSLFLWASIYSFFLWVSIYSFFLWVSIYSFASKFQLVHVPLMVINCTHL